MSDLASTAATKIGAAFLSLALTLAGAAAPTPARAETMSGVFLAAQHAEAIGDIENAARFYRRALVFTPEQPQLLTSALLFTLLDGDFTLAVSLAERLRAVDPASRLAIMVTVVDLARAGRFSEARERLAAGPSAEGDAPAVTLERRLATAWAAFGADDRAAARAAFAPTGRAEIDALFGGYHLGLAEALAGDDAAALAAFEIAKTAAGGWSARLALAAGGALERLGRREEALALYAERLERDAYDPLMLAAQARARAGASAPTLVASAAEGMAELFHGFGVAVAGDDVESARRGLLYARFALALRPGFDEARLLAAELSSELGRHDAAAALYETIAADAPLAEAAAIGRANALHSAERTDEALSALGALTAAGSARPTVYFRIGEILNGEKRYAECAQAYDDGLARLPKLGERDWLALFGLGVCRERLGQWEAAEAAFTGALALEPEQPDVLNYLGYSLVEMGRRFEEARGMIERAVAQRPDSGYIVDSLGWVLYRMGDFDGAARELERAVELAPLESVINDHFGDALWMVGRKHEARFQWRRAQSLGPETDADKLRIEKKLEVGLDAVLAEERAAKEAAARAPAAAEPSAPAATENGG